MITEIEEPQAAEPTEAMSDFADAVFDDDREDISRARTAWVGRTRSRSQEYNTLTPRWHFPFSV